jgi:hypothetical protein
VVGGSGHLSLTTHFVESGRERSALAAKLTVVPVYDAPGGSQEPIAALADFSRHGAVAVQPSANGHFDLSLPEGNYRLYVSRGFEWERAVRDVRIEADADLALDVELGRAFDTTNIAAAELHQHTLGSVDADVPVPLKVLENAAEGIEIAVSTDHDNIIDFAPHVQALGLTGQMQAFAGTEVTYSAIGHFNVYPWRIDPADPLRDVGARLWWGKNVPRVLADARVQAGDPIVQVNHPRSSMSGYFAALGLNPSDATRVPRGPPALPALPDDVYTAWTGDFDVVEVNASLGTAGLFTDEGMEEIARLAREESNDLPGLADYFGLLGAGMKVVAAGNSDTHQVAEGVGYPRNFVFLRDDDPSRITEAAFKAALRAQRMAVGEGCLLTLDVDGQPRMGLGDLVSAGETVSAHLRAPSFVTVPRFEIYVNGRAQGLELLGTPVGGNVAIEPGAPLGLALDDGSEPTSGTRLQLAISQLPTGTDLVVIVIARDGTGLAPTGVGSVFCYSAPLYIDGDGDGRWLPYLEATQTIRPDR